MQIRQDDLRGKEVLALLEAHHQNMLAITPHGSAHALDLAGLRAPEITFWSVWDDGRLAGCGALRALSSISGEIKSMRTVDAHRGRGVASQLLAYICEQAKGRGYATLYLETGSFAAFDAARRLYEKHGFEYCEPFGEYRRDPNSVFMRLRLGG